MTDTSSKTRRKRGKGLAAKLEKMKARLMDTKSTETTTTPAEEPTSSSSWIKAVAVVLLLALIQPWNWFFVGVDDNAQYENHDRFMWILWKTADADFYNPAGWSNYWLDVTARTPAGMQVHRGEDRVSSCESGLMAVLNGAVRNGPVYTGTLEYPVGTPTDITGAILCNNGTKTLLYVGDNATTGRDLYNKALVLQERIRNVNVFNSDPCNSIPLQSFTAPVGSWIELPPMSMGSNQRYDVWAPNAHVMFKASERSTWENYMGESNVHQLRLQSTSGTPEEGTWRFLPRNVRCN